MSGSHQKITKLKNFIKENDEALLITSDVNREYFSGFNSSAGAVLVTKEQAYLLVDFRYGEAAEKKCKSCKVIVFNKLFESIKELVKKHSVSTLYIESTKMSVGYFKDLKNYLKRDKIRIVTTKALDTAITNIRLVKDEYELKSIEEAQKITEKAYLEVLNYIKSGVEERRIALELEYLMRKNGADGVSFDLITITGKKTSLPHGVPDDTKICNGDFFTMDIGALFCGYHSDMTRTVAVGFVSDEQRLVYDTVLKAQLNALSKVKSGVRAEEVDKTARDVIYSAGYKGFFGHATGHGVGMDSHEAPTIGPACKTFLSSNMVITVEPGVYLPDKFGVRIEDMVAVTADGYKNFATVPKELIVL